MWNDLTMAQKADIIQMSVKSGIRDINQIKNAYNSSLMDQPAQVPTQEESPVAKDIQQQEEQEDTPVWQDIINDLRESDNAEDISNTNPTDPPAMRQDNTRVSIPVQPVKIEDKGITRGQYIQQQRDNMRAQAYKNSLDRTEPERLSQKATKEDILKIIEGERQFIADNHLENEYTDVHATVEYFENLLQNSDEHFWDLANCIWTATSNYGKKYRVSGNHTFRENPLKYGFEEIPLSELKPGDLLQYGTDHMTVYDSTGEDGTIYTNYSDGHDNYKKHADMNKEPSRAYRFVGTSDDNVRWNAEYDKQYGKKQTLAQKQFQKPSVRIPFVNTFEYGGPTKRFNKFRETLPDNQRLTPLDKYDMLTYWRLNGKPKDFDEALKREMFSWDDSDNSYHANTLAYDRKGNGRFTKPKDHDTVQYELDYYNNGTITEEGGVQREPTKEEKAEWEYFRNHYELTDDPKRPNFYMYKRKGRKFDLGGFTGPDDPEELARQLRAAVDASYRGIPVMESDNTRVKVPVSTVAEQKAMQAKKDAVAKEKAYNNTVREGSAQLMHDTERQDKFEEAKSNFSIGETIKDAGRWLYDKTRWSKLEDVIEDIRIMRNNNYAEYDIDDAAKTAAAGGIPGSETWWTRSDNPELPLQGFEKVLKDYQYAKDHNITARNYKLNNLGDFANDLFGFLTNTHFRPFKENQNGIFSQLYRAYDRRRQLNATNYMSGSGTPIIDLSNNVIRLTNESKQATALFNEFVETTNPSIHTALDYKNGKVKTFSDKNIPTSNVHLFQGIENGRFKVARIEDFDDNTLVYPVRNIKKDHISPVSSINMNTFDRKSNLGIDPIDFRNYAMSEYSSSLDTNGLYNALQKSLTSARVKEPGNAYIGLMNAKTIMNEAERLANLYDYPLTLGSTGRIDDTGIEMIKQAVDNLYLTDLLEEEAKYRSIAAKKRNEGINAIDIPELDKFYELSDKIRNIRSDALALVKKFYADKVRDKTKTATIKTNNLMRKYSHLFKTSEDGYDGNIITVTDINGNTYPISELNAAVLDNKTVLGNPNGGLFIGGLGNISRSQLDSVNNYLSKNPSWIVRNDLGSFDTYRLDNPSLDDYLKQYYEHPKADDPNVFVIGTTTPNTLYNK